MQQTMETVPHFSILEEDLSPVYEYVYLLTGTDDEPTSGIRLKMSSPGAVDSIAQRSVRIFVCLKPYFFWSMLMPNIMAGAKHC